MKNEEGCIAGPFGPVTIVTGPAGSLDKLEKLLTKQFTDSASYTTNGDVATVSLPRLEDSQKQMLSGSGFDIVRDDYQFSMF